MAARTRVTSATVYADVLAGNDANDGTTPATAVKTLQRAFDYAHGNYDIEPPWTWAGHGNIGYRSAGVTIQMAPAHYTTPYVLPQPTFVDGAGPAGPITLRGATEAQVVANPRSPHDYCLYATNPLQGITSQNGAHVICEGFTIRSDANCTMLNTLSLGKMAMKNVWFGPSQTGGLNAPLGAAGGSQIEIIGNITLIGAGFVAVMTAIEHGRIILAPGASITFDNPMNFGIMVNLQGGGQVWTQGVPPVFNGPGLAASTGKKLHCFQLSYIGFNYNMLPGTFNPATDRDSISYVEGT